MIVNNDSNVQLFNPLRSLKNRGKYQSASQAWQHPTSSREAHGY